MRRISLAVALISAVAAAGCSGGAKPSSSAGAKGTAGSTFTVQVNAQGAGTVTSTPAGISCPGTCSFDFPYDTTVTLSQSTGQYFNGWFGSCDGVATCTLTGNADKYVVAYWSVDPQAHPNFNDPAIHGPAAMGGTLNCYSCHGSQGQGQGLAPSCTGCHTGGAPTASAGLKLAVTSASVDGTAKTFTVRFTVKDATDKALDIVGATSNPVMDGAIRVALARIDKAADGSTLPYAVLTPASGSPSTVTMPKVGVAYTAAAGGVVQNAVGDYTFTSPTLAKIDSTKFTQTHTLWFQATRQASANAFDPKGFAVVNQEFNFVPAGGTAGKREVVSSAACNKCHDGFHIEANATGTGWASFHSGARVEGPFCAACHNPARSFAADSAVFVHRIHAAEHIGLPVSLEFHSLAVTYPQDPRNCKECHAGAAQGDQYKTRPTRNACQSCHYNVSFVTPIPANWPAAGVAAVLHTGGAQADDANCSTCHPAASIDAKHAPVAAKDPNNSLDVATGNIRTNAGAIPAVGAIPAGAADVKFVIQSVEAFNDGTALRPRITFKFTKDGADVVFNAQPAVKPPADPAAIVQLMPGFVGAPSVYFVWAEAQDGIANPVDFNKSASANLLAVQNKQVATQTITGPVGGYYTVTLGDKVIPAAAKMLTGGIGYSYDYPTAAQYATGTIKNQPLTQIDVPAYPFNSATGSGGLIVAAPNVKKTATGYTARRSIVDNAKCNDCHGALGITPNFHVGQRNDGESCSWCHNANRTSSQWSTNASTFIHAIHGAKNRTTPYNWHAACPTGTTFTANTTGDLNTGVCKDAGGVVVAPSPNYPGVEYPGHSCTQCHVSQSAFDYSAGAAGVLWTTVATGTPAVVASISTSPYVTLGANYGTDNTSTASLVSSPISAVCYSCHDGQAAKDHMTTTAAGGKIYVARSAVGGATLTNTEKCLDCHGPGKMAAIGSVHK